MKVDLKKKLLQEIISRLKWEGSRDVKWSLTGKAYKERRYTEQLNINGKVDFFLKVEETYNKAMKAREERKNE